MWLRRGNGCVEEEVIVILKRLSPWVAINLQRLRGQIELLRPLRNLIRKFN